MPPKRQFKEPLDVSARTSKSFNHGISGYRYHKCRCEVCVNAQYEVHQQWIESNRNYANEYARRKHNRSYHTLRLGALEALGGKCAHCGIDDFRVLQIDHINGNGKEDRKKYGGRVTGMYRNIIELGSQETYQTLCANCHAIKTFHS